MTDRLRILHISTRLILGGSQENTVLSCEGQAGLGHDVHLAFGPIYGPEGSLLERVRAFRAADGRRIASHEVPDLIRELHLRRDRRALRQLRALIAELKPDIVHTHSSKAGVLGRLAAFGAPSRPGVVHTIHGPPFMPVEGSLLRRVRLQLLNEVYAVAERRAARRCHVMVAVADAMAAQFLARRIGRPEQYLTVRSGMEVGAFVQAGGDAEGRRRTREALGVAPGDFVIGTVARLAEHKGHDDLLDALGADLRDRPGWRLLWVGDGWWRQRLLEKAERLGVRDRIITTGLVAPERVPPLIAAMDVLAHPSSREGLPRTVPQALLAGVCPVAYDADGTGEVCQHERTGLLVPTGDVLALGAAVRRLAADPALRDRLVRAGRERCARQFSAEGMVRELEKVYARALGLARVASADSIAASADAGGRRR